MADLGAASWLPEPIRTHRLVLRASEARDRSAMIDLQASPEVQAYAGGPQPRDRLESAMPPVPGQRLGFFVVEADGRTIGVVTIDRRPTERDQVVRAESPELELGYLFLPDAWGNGYATEACSAVLDWCAETLPGEPIVAFTQTANAASMRVLEKLGFGEVKRFDAWGAEQWLGVRRSG